VNEEDLARGGLLRQKKKIDFSTSSHQYLLIFQKS
jgi:hypothetical protein